MKMKRLERVFIGKVSCVCIKYLIIYLSILLFLSYVGIGTDVGC